MILDDALKLLADNDKRLQIIETTEGHNFSSLNIGTATGSAIGDIAMSGALSTSYVGDSILLNTGRSTSINSIVFMGSEGAKDARIRGANNANLEMPNGGLTVAGNILTTGFVRSDGGYYNDTASNRTGMNDYQSGTLAFRAGGLDNRVKIFSNGDIINVGEIGSTATYTLNSAADVLGPRGTGFIVILRDNNNGSTALILYENAQTPVIISQVSGGSTVFVTAAPAATEIQVKASATNFGIDLRAGASRNNVVVNALTLFCDNT